MYIYFSVEQDTIKETFFPHFPFLFNSFYTTSWERLVTRKPDNKERERLCVRLKESAERERKCVCMCVCERERMRKRVCVCV